MARVSTCTVASVRVNVILVTGERSNTLALAARITAAAIALAGSVKPPPGRRVAACTSAGVALARAPPVRARASSPAASRATASRSQPRTAASSRLRIGRGSYLTSALAFLNPASIAGPAAATELDQRAGDAPSVHRLERAIVAGDEQAAQARCCEAVASAEAAGFEQHDGRGRRLSGPTS